MAKHNTSAYIECPFHKWYDGCKLCCEGVQKGSAIHLAFGSDIERREYMKKICYTNFKKCIIAKALYTKYSDTKSGG